ncbi:hypothetical protein FA10DRAFT_263637 [Acaromyces ingoldii]|uniref:VWFA domain-containing protein n=1 Tax=Acaromyces ingoldii TaxID=215250 RepID=A0A316YTK4_9BASI|nr:hypothetical protein FA10DRAFT_263637 [Acaromyces ingoldii]PWN92900.1 hypothetical protein FA10DRAFT_263637 [Acaromyces ingoldii]
MTFNRKLLLAGLAVGITSYALYKLSKKKEKEKLQHGQQYHWQPTGHHAAPWAIAGAAAGGVAAAGGAAYYHHHHQQQLQQQQQQHHPQIAHSAGTPTGDVWWASLRDANHIADLLSACVVDQNLYAFYNFDRIRAIAQQIAASGALAEVCESWQLPPSLGQDLVKLALFDVSFLLDDSASMRSEGHLRRDTLLSILKRAADAAGRFDRDGMEVLWMNGQKHAPERIHTADEAKNLVSACKWQGNATPLGDSLQRLIQANVLNKAKHGQLHKPALVIVITDGRPTGPTEHNNRMSRVVADAKAQLAATPYGEDALSLSIAAVGNDDDAQSWLDFIDADPHIGGLVDVTSDRRKEAVQVRRATGIELTDDLHALKVLLGGIDSSFDASDEGGKHSNLKLAARGAQQQKHQQHFEAFEAQRWQQQRDEALRAGVAPPQKPPFVRDEALPIHPAGAAFPPVPSSLPSAPYGQANLSTYPGQAPSASTYPGEAPSNFASQSSYPGQAQSSYPGGPQAPFAGGMGATGQSTYPGGPGIGQQSSYPGGPGIHGQSSYPGGPDIGSAPPPYAMADQYPSNSNFTPTVGGFAMPSGPGGAATPNSSYPGQYNQQNNQGGGPGFPSAFPSSYPYQ